MYSALDIAKYIIAYEHSKGREVSNLRLQKLLYFVQAKFFQLYGTPCFSENMEAWDFGPVVVSVYHEYKIFGSLDIMSHIEAPHISKDATSVINDILDYAAPYPTFQLVDITHDQKPWIDAKANYFNHTISMKSLRDYFYKG